MSAGRLRILLVTESTDDGALAALVLRQVYTEVEVWAVGDALEFADRLAGGGFSVALADKRLSWADGVSVLEAIRRRYPECANLLLVDSPSQADQGDGVDVSVTKNSRGFVDLPNAIQRAQRLVQTRFQDDASVTAYQRLVAELPVGVFSMDPETTITQANELTLTTLGFDDSEPLLGRRLSDLIADADLRSRCLALVERGQSLRDVELPIRRSDGGIAKVSLSYWPVANPRGEIEFFEGALWDLSAIASAGQGRAGVNVDQLASAVSHDLQDPLQLIAPVRSTID